MLVLRAVEGGAERSGSDRIARSPFQGRGGRSKAVKFSSQNPNPSRNQLTFSPLGFSLTLFCEIDCRQEQFDKSAIGRAAKAQMAAAKQSQVSSKGEPVLKVYLKSLFNLSF